MAYTPPNGSNVPLEFGGDYAAPAAHDVPLNFSDASFKDRSLTIGFLLPGPVLAVNADAAEAPEPAYELTATLMLGQPILSAVARYDINVSRVLASDTRCNFEVGQLNADMYRQSWQKPHRQQPQPADTWQQGQPATAAMRAVYESGILLRQSRHVRWDMASLCSVAPSDCFGELLRKRTATTVPWQAGGSMAVASTNRFKDLYRVRHAVESRWQRGGSIAAAWRFLFSMADWINLVNAIVWQRAQKPPVGRSKPAPVIPPKSPEYHGSTLLNFMCALCCIDPLDIELNFGDSPCLTNHKTIFIMNEVSLKRVSDGAAIEIQSAKVGIDKNSWCWSFAGTIPKSELAKVRPGSGGPVEVELSVNGFKWRFIVESYNESKQFANTSVSVQGRSVTALLDAPYAAVRSYTEVATSYARTLAENELVRNGEASSFSLDWQLIDALGWLVPGNVFNYSNLTPVGAIKAIAESVGGYVNSDPVTRTLYIRPEYAFPVWQLASQSPDKTISYDFVTRESLQWSAKPAYDKVFVTGENNGVQAPVRKAGTAGTNEAPQVVNQLITDGAAARQRGIVELSRGGKQADISIELPLVADIGLCLPSQIIDFEVPCDGACMPGGLEAWRGIVNGVSIDVASSDGKLTVTQTVELERRYED